MMANLFKLLVRKTIFSGDRNLISLEEPYKAMANLLRGREVTAVIDAGASNGRISQRLLRLFPNALVFAFEPNPLYSDPLKRLEAENDRFHPLFLALSDREGEENLFFTDSPGSTSLFPPTENLRTMAREASAVKKIEKVETVTIDGWNERGGNFPVQVMKLDIQGGEVRALEGAKRVLAASTLVIYTEILFNPLYDGGAIFGEVDRCLRDKGFVLFDIFKPRYHRNGKLLWANAIFVHAGRMER